MVSMVMLQVILAQCYGCIWFGGFSDVVVVAGISFKSTCDLRRGGTHKMCKLGFVSFGLLAPVVIDDVDGDATRYSCAVMWLYMVGGASVTSL